MIKVDENELIKMDNEIKMKEAIIDFTRETIFWITKQYIELEKEMELEKGILFYRDTDILEFLKRYKDILDRYAGIIDEQKSRFRNLNSLRKKAKKEKEDEKEKTT